MVGRIFGPAYDLHLRGRRRHLPDFRAILRSHTTTNLSAAGFHWELASPCGDLAQNEKV